MAYTFDQIFAADENDPNMVATGGTVLLFAPGDVTKTPLEITDNSGVPLANPVPVNEKGFGPAFMSELDRVAWEAGGLSGFFTSYEGMRDVAVQAAADASSARLDATASAEAATTAAVTAVAEVQVTLSGAVTAAEQAAADAARLAGLVGAPADEAIAAALDAEESQSRAAMSTAIAGAIAPKLDSSEKGAASGVASLDDNSKVPLAQVPDILKTDNGGKPVAKGELVVNAKDHGAVGDGVFNDRWGIQAAIDNAKGKDIILQGGTTYRLAGTLIMPTNSDSVSIKAVGPKPATLYVDNQSFTPVRFEQPTASATTTLTASTGINSRGWAVASAAGIEKGMICEVISSKHWYHDPRPESAPNDARKSELHRVQDTFLGVVYMDDPANDGYDIATETVTLKFYRPIKVRLENIKVVATLPAVAEETNALEGIVIEHADEPEVINVDVENCARTGIAVYKSYRPRIIGGTTRRANNFYNGYGVSINGCAHALVRDRHTYESRRAVDVTGFNVISRQAVIENCKAFGGGKNSRGETYGWLPNGAAGAYQGGFGSHGAADTTTYRNNAVYDMHAPFTVRGRTSIIENNLIVGRTSGGAIQASFATNLYVRGNKAIAGYWNNKPYDPFIAGENINIMRADTLVTIYSTWEGNPATGLIRGQLVITNNEAEVKFCLLRMHALVRGQVHIAGNRAMLMPPNLATNVCLIDNQSGETPTAGIMGSYWIGPNSYFRPLSGGGTVTHTINLPLTGANVINYTVSA